MNMENIIKQDTDFIIKSLGNDIAQLQNKKILLTGATGFIGTHLLNTVALFNDLYNTLPCQVTAVARNPKRLVDIAPYLFNRQDIKIISGDVRTFVFPQEHFDYVIHAASPVDPLEVNRNRLETIDIITNGTSHILQQSAEHKIGRFLYISSGAVYGVQPPDLPQIPEDYSGGPNIANPAFAYGEAKRFAEMLCSIFSHLSGISIVTARPFTFVGPYQSLDAGFAITQFISQGLNGGVIRIEGDGAPLRSYCYGADLAVALWKILLNADKGRIYNIGSEKAISILELAQMVVSVLGEKVKIEVKQKPQPGQKPARYIPNINRIKSELNFYPNFDLSEAVTRTVAWARQDKKINR